MLHHNDLSLFDGVLPLLSALRARNHTLAVATGKSRRGLDDTLQSVALQGMFELAARQLAPSAPALQLTPREWQVAELLRAGLSNKEVARQLGVGLPTIKTHLINLFRKVAVSNRTELVTTLFL